MTGTQEDMMQAPAEERYNFALATFHENGEVWALAEGEDWLLIAVDGDECLPVWPTSQLALQWGKDWPAADVAAEAKRITLEDWLGKWLPGMIEDKLSVAVCPGGESDAVILSAEDMKTAIENYETKD